MRPDFGTLDRKFLLKVLLKSCCVFEHCNLSFQITELCNLGAGTVNWKAPVQIGDDVYFVDKGSTGVFGQQIILKISKEDLFAGRCENAYENAVRVFYGQRDVGLLQGKVSI